MRFYCINIMFHAMQSLGLLIIAIYLQPKLYPSICTTFSVPLTVKYDFFK